MYRKIDARAVAASLRGRRGMDMATDPLGKILKHLCQALTPPGGDGLTDGQLLSRFVASRDEAAFEALVQRHGPMVLGVCCRVLRDDHDADDAFQGTVLL